MTQAQPKITFEEYLSLTNFEGLGLPEGICEFVDGEFVELPPESRLNLAIANYLFALLLQQGIPYYLMYLGNCELEVPVLKAGHSRTRFPDLVVLAEEHLPLTAKRCTVTVAMPPPPLVVEIVSPGETNRTRDYKDKFQQYEKRGIPEYWLIDPQQQVILIFGLEDKQYQQLGQFTGQQMVQSRSFPHLQIQADAVFASKR